jgi:hypothetical protein
MSPMVEILTLISARIRPVAGGQVSDGVDTRQTPGQNYSDLGFRVEAKGLEPSNLLTASHIFGVQEGSSSAVIGVLPGSSVQSCSDPFSGIRSRCLHNCLHSLPPSFPIRRPVGFADGILTGEVPHPSGREVDRSGPRVSGPAPSTHCSEREARYPEPMAAQPVMTAEEWFEGMRHARPPTPDDVTILWDGRRLDSREAVMEWLAEVEAKRAEEATAGANAEP